MDKATLVKHVEYNCTICDGPAAGSGLKTCCLGAFYLCEAHFDEIAQYDAINCKECDKQLPLEVITS